MRSTHGTCFAEFDDNWKGYNDSGMSFNKIDLRNIPVETLKEIDLENVDLSVSAPDFEPQRQYYFMAKCRKYVGELSENLGRRLSCAVITFGCPTV